MSLKIIFQEISNISKLCLFVPVTLGALAFSQRALANEWLNDRPNHHNENSKYHCNGTASAKKLGEKLEHEFWNNVKNQNVKAYSYLLAEIFQGLSITGVYSREDEINGLKQATLKKFRIENLCATQRKDVLVVSYDLVAHGKGITSGPEIDVWNKIKDEWKIVSSSYVPFER